MENFQTPGEVVHQNWNFERNQQFFGCEDWSEEDIDLLVAMEEKKAENAWMQEHPQRVKRVYVMALEFAKERAPVAGHLREVS